MLGASLITLSQLQKVLFSYLTMVWKTVNGFLIVLCPPFPMTHSFLWSSSTNPHHIIFQRHINLNPCVILSTATPCGTVMVLWHTFYGHNSDKIGWFSNKAIRHILHQTLVNSRSRTTYIGVIEYVYHESCTPTGSCIHWPVNYLCHWDDHICSCLGEPEPSCWSWTYSTLSI